MRIVIIGDGVIGRCTAYYAAGDGHDVMVVERAPAGHEGCSFGNAGMVVPSHFVPLAAPGMVTLGLRWMWNPESPFYIKPRFSWDLIRWGMRFWRSATSWHVERVAPLLRDLHLASRACFEALAAEPGREFGLVKKGLLMLCKTERGLEEESHVAERARAFSVPAEVLTADQAARLEPEVRMDIAGAVHFPLDCHLDPEKFMGTLQSRLEERRVTFHWNAQVTGWVKEGNRIKAVQTSQGDFEADEYVLCGGAWSPLIVRELGLRLPMQAGKGYSVTLTEPRQLPSRCAIFTEARVAVTPMGRALRFGGTMELSGMNEQINPARVRGLLKSIPQYYPEFREEDFRGRPVWRGLRPCSPDGMPYVGRWGRYANFSVATGHAMMGLSLAPITGRLMAEVLRGAPPSIDLSLLRPDRFA